MITLKYNTDKTVKKEQNGKIKHFSKKYKKKYNRGGALFDTERRALDTAPIKTITKIGLITDILKDNKFILTDSELTLDTQKVLEALLFKKLLVYETSDGTKPKQFYALSSEGAKFKFNEKERGNLENDLVSDTIKFLKKSLIYKNGLNLSSDELKKPDCKVNITINYKDYTVNTKPLKIITGITLNKDYKTLYIEAFFDILYKISNPPSSNITIDELKRMPKSMKILQFLADRKPSSNIAGRHTDEDILINFYISDEDAEKNELIRLFTTIANDNSTEQDITKAQAEITNITLGKFKINPKQVKPPPPQPRQRPVSLRQRRPPLKRLIKPNPKTYPPLAAKRPGVRPDQKRKMGPLSKSGPQPPPQQKPGQPSQPVRTTGTQQGPQSSLAATGLASMFQIGSQQFNPNRGSDGRNRGRDTSQEAVRTLTKQMEELKRAAERERRKKEEEEKTKKEKDKIDPLNNLAPQPTQNEAKNIEKIQKSASSKNYNLVKDYEEMAIFYNWNEHLDNLKGMLAFFLSENVENQLNIVANQLNNDENDNIFYRSIEYYPKANSANFNESKYTDNKTFLSNSKKIIGNETVLALKLYENMNIDINNCKVELNKFINPFTYVGIVQNAIKYASSILIPKFKTILDEISKETTPEEKKVQLRNQLSILRQSVSDDTNSEKLDTPETQPKIKINPVDTDETVLNSWGTFKKQIEKFMQKINIKDINDEFKWKKLLSKYIEETLKKSYEEFLKKFDECKQSRIFANSQELINEFDKFIKSTFIDNTNTNTATVIDPNYNINISEYNIKFGQISKASDTDVKSKFEMLQSNINNFTTYVNEFNNFYSRKNNFKKEEINNYTNLKKYISFWTRLIQMLLYQKQFMTGGAGDEHIYENVQQQHALINDFSSELTTFIDKLTKAKNVATKLKDSNDSLTQEEENIKNTYLPQKDKDGNKIDNFNQNYTTPFNKLKMLFDYIIGLKPIINNLNSLLIKTNKTIVNAKDAFNNPKQEIDITEIVLQNFDELIVEIDKLDSQFKQSEKDLMDLSDLTGQNTSKTLSDLITLNIKGYAEKIKEITTAYDIEKGNYQDQIKIDDMFNKMHPDLITNLKATKTSIEESLQKAKQLLIEKPDPTIQATITQLEKEFTELSAKLPPLFNINQGSVQIDNLNKLIGEAIKKATELKAKLDEQKKVTSTNKTPNQIAKLFLEKNETDIKELKSQSDIIMRSIKPGSESYIEIDPGKVTDQNLKRKLFEFDIKTQISKLQELMTNFQEPEKNLDDLLEEGNKLTNNIYILIDILAKSYKSLYTTKTTQSGGTDPPPSVTTNPGTGASVNFGVLPTTTTVPTSEPTTTTATTTTTAPAPTTTTATTTTSATNKTIITKEDINTLLDEIQKLKDNAQEGRIPSNDQLKKDQSSIIQNLFDAKRSLELIREKIVGIKLNISNNTNSISKQSRFSSLSSDILKMIDRIQNVIGINNTEDKVTLALNDITSIIEAIEPLLKPEILLPTQEGQTTQEGQKPHLQVPSILKQLYDDIMYNIKPNPDLWKLLTAYSNAWTIDEFNIKENQNQTIKQEIIRLITKLPTSILDKEIDAHNTNQNTNIKVSDLFAKLVETVETVKDKLTPDLLTQYGDIKTKIELLNKIKDYKTPELPGDNPKKKFDVSINIKTINKFVNDVSTKLDGLHQYLINSTSPFEQTTFNDEYQAIINIYKDFIQVLNSLNIEINIISDKNILKIDVSKVLETYRVDIGNNLGINPTNSTKEITLDDVDKIPSPKISVIDEFIIQIYKPDLLINKVTELVQKCKSDTKNIEECRKIKFVKYSNKMNELITEIKDTLEPVYSNVSEAVQYVNLLTPGVTAIQAPAPGVTAIQVPAPGVTDAHVYNTMPQSPQNVPAEKGYVDMSRATSLYEPV